MPRQARIDAPGALHHIIVRGIERRKIFKDDTDRYDFLDRLGKVLTETGTTCFAWSLIPNHFHLLLRTGQRPISKVMSRLLTDHAMASAGIAVAASCFKTVINPSFAKKTLICLNWYAIFTLIP